ncbi:diguanylate cyclase [Persephonella sp.]|nr:diguanylate cyclase [Aquificota bacterium]
MKSIKTRLVFRVLSILFILFIVTQILEYTTFRVININNAESQSRVIAQLIQNTLTMLMEFGKINERHIFLENIQSRNGNIKEIRVIRGENVIKQYGPGFEDEKPKTPEERKVLETGIPYTRLDETFEKVEYVYIQPYRAIPIGKIDCLKCHDVKAGDILGAVYIRTDLTTTRNLAFSNLIQITFISLLTFIFTGFIIYRFFKPYTEFFSKLKTGLLQAREGNFSSSVEINTEDEAQELASVYNETMKNLSRTLNDIEEKASFLISGNLKKTGNILNDTTEIIENLVDIYRFKRIVEKDSSKEDIYTRLRELMRKMEITKYSIYEVDYKNNRLIDIDESAKWCKDPVFNDSDECRVKRTGSEVISEDFSCLCPNFIECNDEGGKTEHYYICIPIYVAGKVGIILQLVYTEEEKEKIKAKLPYIESYIKEVAPVLEAKTFMERLKEQSYIDQLTGLYNRRFLEEILPKLTKQVLRRNSTLGILMIDIDNFKQINDSYGHDAGDEVLSRIGELLKRSVRESDYVVRYGGEEFMVILVDIQKNTSRDVAEKIRKIIENTYITAGGQEITPTVSIGTAEFPEDSEDIYQVIKFADIALYRAKKDGKNRVVRFRKELLKNGD